MGIKFEMGNVDVRNAEFDHHSEIPHSQAFIAKMSSVQLIEWFVMTGQPAEVLEDMAFNHFGHIDDLVALALPRVAGDREAVQALYRFACEASVIDSCGPSGYLLVSKDVQEVVNACLGRYHDGLKSMGTNSREASLIDKRAAMQQAARLLVEKLGDRRAPATVQLDPLPEGSADVEYRNLSGKKVAFVTIRDKEVNIFRHAAWLYDQGAEIVVSRNDGSWTVLAASNYSTDLSGLWSRLTEEESEGRWGGHAGAGGSDRELKSTLTMSQVEAVLRDHLAS